MLSPAPRDGRSILPLLNLLGYSIHQKKPAWAGHRVVCLRFRHWGEPCEAKRVAEGVVDLKTGKTLARQPGGYDARPGEVDGDGRARRFTCRASPLGIDPLHRSIGGEMEGGVIVVGRCGDYGGRAFSRREYCSRSMRLSFSRNLPRAGSGMSSRMRPNSANVSKQNRWR